MGCCSATSAEGLLPATHSLKAAYRYYATATSKKKKKAAAATTTKGDEHHDKTSCLCSLICCLFPFASTSHAAAATQNDMDDVRPAKDVDAQRQTGRCASRGRIKWRTLWKNVSGSISDDELDYKLLLAGEKRRRKSAKQTREECDGNSLSVFHTQTTDDDDDSCRNLPETAEERELTREDVMLIRHYLLPRGLEVVTWPHGPSVAIGATTRSGRPLDWTTCARLFRHNCPPLVTIPARARNAMTGRQRIYTAIPVAPVTMKNVNPFEGSCSSACAQHHCTSCCFSHEPRPEFAGFWRPDDDQPPPP